MSSFFTKEEIEKLYEVKNPTKNLSIRRAVLRGGLEKSSKNPEFPIEKIKPIREMWDSYFQCAVGCGLWDITNPKDQLKIRLLEIDDSKFHGALSECMACWFFKRLLKMSVKPIQPNKTVKSFDLKVEFEKTCFSVEVKAPFEEYEDLTVYWDNFIKERRSIKKAREQLDKNQMNIVFLVPEVFDLTLFTMVTACYGQSGFTAPYIKKTGEIIDEPKEAFFPNGVFFKNEFSHIGAVITFQERFENAGASDKLKIGHCIWILHNPLAKNPIPRKIWGSIFQLYFEDHYLIRSDTGNKYQD